MTCMKRSGGAGGASLSIKVVYLLLSDICRGFINQFRTFVLFRSFVFLNWSYMKLPLEGWGPLVVASFALW